MNRFKREIRKRGEKLENDYEYLPYDGIETVKVDAEKATISYYHVSAGWEKIQYYRDMSAEFVHAYGQEVAV